MVKWGTAAKESASRNLAEAQERIDASARKVVEAITRTIDVQSDETPSSRAAFPGRDFTWYDQVVRALANEGFGTPVGMEPRAWLTRPVESRSLAEYAAGDAGTVLANWFELPPRGNKPAHRVISLVTATQDGHSFTTSFNGTPTGLPLPPTKHVEYVSESMSLAALLARHRATVAHHGATPRAFADFATYLEWHRHEQERTAHFRRAQGLGLIERFLEERFGGEGEEAAREQLKSVRAHPEWYKYAASTDSASIDAKGAG